MMVTDPPYGVEYAPTWRADAGVNKNQGKMGVVKNDDVADWSPAWKLFEGDVGYVYHAGRMASTVQASLECSGFVTRAQIIWAKDRMALSRGDYHWQHEPIWYVVRDGKPAHRTDDRTQTTLWTIPARDDAGHGHGTQKPLECMARPIRNHTFSVVYDPFLGSGTTMVACENLKRKCRGIEISPDYCSVILQRMADAFPNLKAERIKA
jgi:DNA modification methylase